MLSSLAALEIISVVPRLPPAIGGVGAHALCLAEQMRADAGIETRFIVADPNWGGPSQVQGFTVTVLKERSGNELSSVLRLSRNKQPQILVVHLSGYGYAKWSMYQWLIEGLKQWKQSYADAFLLTMFHELYCAYGKPWKHSFWTSALQRRLASSLAILSDASLTNCTRHADRISQLSRGKHTDTPVLPIFSNIGEPRVVLPVAERQRQLVIFGGPVTRRRAYESSHAQIHEFCKRYKISRVVDIGEPTGLALGRLDLPPVIEMGCLSSYDISDLLMNSIFGWLSYENYDVDKSSVLAAYCSHGVVPMIHIQSPSPLLSWMNEEGHHRIFDMTQKAVQMNLSLIDLQALSNDIFDWYKMHDIASHSNAFTKEILELIRIHKKADLAVSIP